MPESTALDLPRYQTISFDIFDTLVSRRLHSPKDVFSLVQAMIAGDEAFLHCPRLLDHYAEARIAAEEQARASKVAAQGGEPEILIEAIYAELQRRYPALDDQLRQQLLARELAAEQAVLYRHPQGAALFEQAKASGARIVLISDMYLPSTSLRQLLQGCGYALDGIPVFSSGEEGVSKHSGQLYARVRDRLGLNPASWLHIGDNPHADVRQAIASQLAAHHAGWSQYSQQASMHWKSADVLGSSITKALNLKQAAQFHGADPLAEIGFKVFGPLLLGYIAWLSRQFKLQGVEQALFLARDAHLIFKLYQRHFAAAGVPGEYVYISRASAYQMGLTDWPMHRIWHLFGGKSRKPLRKILAVAGVQAERHLTDIHHVGFPDEDHIPQPGEEARVHWLLNKIFIDIMLSNTECRQVYADYFRQACGDASRVALVDLGWMGNIQAVFARALGAEWADKTITGFYLGTLQGAGENRSLYNQMYGWLVNYGHPEDRHGMLLAGGIELLEFAMADNTGTTLGYTRTEQGIVPIRDQTSDAEQDYLHKAATLQQGIVSFFDYIQPLIELDPSVLDSTCLAQPFIDLVMQPSTRQLEALAALTHSDSAGANTQRWALAEQLSLWQRLRAGQAYQQGMEKSFWKEGFRRLNRKRFWARYD